MTREQAINSMISHGFTVEQAGEIFKAVTPQEPKTGHWGWLRCDMYVCSECRNVYTDLSGIKDGMNYCPNCGSRNEVEE